MVELPYKGNTMVMQILLPNDKFGLGAVEENLNGFDVQKAFEKEKYKTKVNLKLPKFMLEQTINLKKVFKKMGMEKMFSGFADFSGIDGTRLLYVSDVVQKAFIEVNEEGSEAAAATAVVMMKRTMPHYEQFAANHPFIFYLRDKTTGMLLFQGRVNNPLE